MTIRRNHACELGVETNGLHRSHVLHQLLESRLGIHVHLVAHHMCGRAACVYTCVHACARHVRACVLGIQQTVRWGHSVHSSAAQRGV